MPGIVTMRISTVLAQSGAGPGEGFKYRLEPTWSLAPAVLLILVVAAVTAVVLVYLRERGGAGRSVRLALSATRLLLIGMVLLMLFGWVLHRDRTDLPDLVILIDDSASMQLADNFADEELAGSLNQRLADASLQGTTRANLAKLLLLEKEGELLRRLGRQYNLKLYRISSSARVEAHPEATLAQSVRAMAADQSASRLGKCLRDVLELQRGRPTAAVVMLTDGITTEGKTVGEVAEYARRKAIPLHIVGLGSDQPQRDVRITDLLVDDVVFVNDFVTFEARLSSTGYDGETVMLRLREKEGGRVLDEQPMTLSRDGQTQSVRLAHRPEQPGQFEFVVESLPLAGESDLENNGVTQTISVRDETIRVLLAYAYPSYEYRYLSTLLGRQLQGQRRDAEKPIDLTVVLQEADQRFAEADERVRRVFPVRREELFEYDVVIFGDVNPAGIGRLEMNNLVDFVKVRGGGIVFISGPRHTPLEYRDTPLAELMPVDVHTASLPLQPTLKEAFSVQLTPLGLTSRPMQLSDKPGENLRVWQQLAGLHWLLEAPDVKPAAQVLAEHPTRTGSDGRNLPIICMQFVGAGKVIFHATDETHRWRFRVGDKYFARYWIQTIRSLSRAKLLGKSRSAELTSDFEEYRRGQPVQLRVRFFDERLAPSQDDGVTVVLERDSGQRQHVKLTRQSTSRGVFQGTMTDLAEGQYRAWLASPTLIGKPLALRLAVVAPPGEQARLEMDSADLKLAAKVSNGRFYTIDTADRMGKDLPRGRQVRIASLPPLSIWGRWPIAVAFGSLFVLLLVSEWLLRKRVGML